MGVYYISSDYIYQHGNWESKSIFIKDNKFTITFNNKNKAKELNVDQFWIGPGKVYLDLEDPVYSQDYYEHSLKKYIYRGCTLLLCQLPVQSNFKLQQKFLQFKERLSLISPIDFMIVPSIPITKLTLEQIKFFGKEKVPFILIKATNKDEFKHVKWQWIQQTQNFSRIPIKFLTKNSELLKEWKKITKKCGIDTFDQEINTNPLSKEVLRLTGISPHKGEFIHQGCADYNLFDLSSVPSFDDQAEFRYHKAIPVITVSNGNVVKANHLVQLDTAQGRYTQVSIPRHFV